MPASIEQRSKDLGLKTKTKPKKKSTKKSTKKKTSKKGGY
jgi:hypothetical protein